MDAIAVCTQAQVEMFGKARLDLVEELTTPDVIDHGAPPQGTHGREALKGRSAGSILVSTTSPTTSRTRSRARNRGL